MMARLMRRAGFGEPRWELDARTAKGYKAVVEELLHPEEQPAISDELMYRIFPGYEGALGVEFGRVLFRSGGGGRCIPRMVLVFGFWRSTQN